MSVRRGIMLPSELGECDSIASSFLPTGTPVLRLVGTYHVVGFFLGVHPSSELLSRGDFEGANRLLVRGSSIHHGGLDGRGAIGDWTDEVLGNFVLTCCALRHFGNLATLRYNFFGK